MCNRAVDVLQTHSNTKVSDDNVIHYHLGMLTQIFASAKDKPKLDSLKKYGEAQDADKKGKQQQKPTLPQDNIPAWPQLIDVKEMKATDNALDEGTNAIRLFKAGQDPLKPVPRKKRVGGALFLDGGGLSTVTDYRASLDKHDLSSTPSTSSRTKKRKSDSSDEVRCWST
ncbi:hypothetical protein DFS33DRAFT_1480829 [Desarmillaria ectypa]|nr:hypothetical protein DFS33DRAFT_1480829 [Desarmillaria ectypa]